jgi:hypothetical protein
MRTSLYLQGVTPREFATRIHNFSRAASVEAATDVSYHLRRMAASLRDIELSRLEVQ